jgi:hypothetical protein
VGDEGTDVPTVIEPVEQRLVPFARAGDDEVLTARTETSDIYLPLRPLFTALGLAEDPAPGDTPAARRYNGGVWLLRRMCLSEGSCTAATHRDDPC